MNIGAYNRGVAGIAIDEKDLKKINKKHPDMVRHPGEIKKILTDFGVKAEMIP